MCISVPNHNIVKVFLKEQNTLKSQIVFIKIHLVSLLQIRIQFVRQRFNPTLETNKQTNIKVLTNFNSSCAKIENPNCSSMIMKWAYYPLDLIYFVINWTAILTMMLNLPHLRNWKIPPLALQTAKLFVSMSWNSDFRKSLPKKKKKRTH